jgi:hypothetical protein
MKKVNLKQGTLQWENAKTTRIGSSEVFDIVRYYATDTELMNSGINPEAIKAEKPHTTVWALYHKLHDDGLYQKGQLAPELADYGHAVEPYGALLLQQGRQLKLRRGEVYTEKRLIASLDIAGVSEEIDERDFDFGEGRVLPGKRFVCEQKSMMPIVIKNGLPIKYIIQAQYQISMTRADFFILQVMVLENDTVFERGKITQIGKAGAKKLAAYLDGKMKVQTLYFANNERLAKLIDLCLKRFFADVDEKREPLPFLPHDSQKNVLESIRINSFYNKDAKVESEHLADYLNAKTQADEWDDRRIQILNNILHEAKNNNTTRFYSADGHFGSFDARGAFTVKAPKES